MGYRNVYRGVFPIKVNQLREVVEEILDAGKPFHFGLEAGSKPELIAALAMHNDPESLIICNGYKDRAFIRDALLGRKLGKTVIMVVEKLEELTHILAASLRKCGSSRTSAFACACFRKAPANGRRAEARTRNLVCRPPTWSRRASC